MRQRAERRDSRSTPTDTRSSRRRPAVRIGHAGRRPRSVRRCRRRVGHLRRRLSKVRRGRVLRGGWRRIHRQRVVPAAVVRASVERGRRPDPRREEAENELVEDGEGGQPQRRAGGGSACAGAGAIPATSAAPATILFMGLDSPWGTKDPRCGNRPTPLPRARGCTRRGKISGVGR